MDDAQAQTGGETQDRYEVSAVSGLRDSERIRAPEDPLPHPPPDVNASVLAELFPADDPAWAWARVDLDALREEIPDNLAFALAVPTTDSAVLAEREETRARWKREYGRIVSYRATENEVRDYYAERQRVSSDYVVFTDILIERYGDVLPEQDLGLLQLAQTLHRARLEEMPRRLAEALERREAHELVRAAWRADEAAFSDSASGAAARAPEPPVESDAPESGERAGAEAGR